ncbi:HAMP domain-containing histidine kinase [Flagellimonas sp. HMM57]|uniref:sensor histidine kinase n=1 Tax=unclassified Flagellimonas TaxID=2644544 RepID=UPI0013D457D9|nr:MULTISPECIES: HAMP domain-containing sensor histidine kinase [unclassified Flagellimonas]MBS9462605.1 HAMP domain-containing histidine kinase [Flagellimonas sp. 389]UII76490.1 HAMP domain-containing histidine kinase [Flagellimonas sp. HMM57]
MNLVRKTNRNYLIFLLFLFPIMVAVDYYVIEYFVNFEVNDVLLHESERIDYELKQNGSLPHSNYTYRTEEVSNDFNGQNKFGDTLVFEAYANKQIPYRTYQFTVDTGSQKMRVSLWHILLEMNELIIWLLGAATLVLLMLLSGLFFINRRIYKWAWKPFFHNLSALKNYDITSKEPVQLKPSKINEFKELDKVVTALMEQVKKDFQNLKEFNENISHEVQTPLAIIRNKMVLLLESNNLNKEEQQWAQAVYQEANKLSKISKSLTLISRIENQEFKRLDTVDIGAVIDNIVRNMEEIIKFKNINTNIDLDSVTVQCDQILANILFTNLIKNAVQHNREGGYINMTLTSEKFEITNTGSTSDMSTAQLFNRFQKGNKESDSLGLGLSINQKICDIYGFRLDYERDNDKHTFSLFF